MIETHLLSPVSPQPTDWILQLPDELQIKILGHLPPVDRILAGAVCQKWKRLAFDGTLWACTDATPFYRTIPADQLLRLGVAAGKYLRVANFRGCIQLTGHELRTLSDHCPNVDDLNLRDCRSLSTHSIACFLQSVKNLRTLNLSGLDTVTNSTLQLVSQLMRLEKLDISWCRNISGKGVQAIGAHCFRLSSLKLNGCALLDDTAMGALGRNLRHLSRLSLASCTTLTDDMLLTFLAYQRHHGWPLTHLNLSGCARLTDASLRHIAVHCTSPDLQQQPHLTHLELTECELLTDQGFSYLAPRLRTLVHVDLEDLPQITEITVAALANNEPNLRKLCLSNCTQISDDAIVHLVLHGVSRCIEHLELNNCTVTDHALEMISSFLRDQQAQRKKSTTPDSGLELGIPGDPVQSLYMEVLDCASISEDGVKSALAKAGVLLTLKSFYSWQDQNMGMSRDDNDGDDGVVHSHRVRRPAVSAATSARRRYNTIGFHRRRPESAGQLSASNCVIL
ncbi:hypothetical protein BX666DRAFT_1855826 [Dichotomocladium elegans]|nr:hypothetical protein BX666DRAFT_1855826 [Dichotomocladium elegans]